MTTAAPFAYYGGKAGLAPLIVGLLPPHRTYIEPYLGSGAVLFAKRPVVHEIVNDLDGAVVAFFRCLRDRLPELERACALTPHARDELRLADLAEPGLDDLELARRFWVRVGQSFGKTAVDRRGWSVTTSRSQSVPAMILSRINRFGPAAARLANVSVECCDGADLVVRLATPDTVVYCDPPYVTATRRGADRSRQHDYRHEMGDDAHRRLAGALQATSAVVVLSGYPGGLYDELYAGWWTLDVPVLIKASNARVAERASRIERIWSNRDLGAGRLPLLYETPGR